MIASRLLSSLRRGSEWRVALVIFAGLPAAKIAKSPGIYSALMSVLASRHLWQDSLALLRDAEEGSNLELDAAVYNSAITTCARASRWQWSLWLLAYLREADSGRTPSRPNPNVISYNAAIHACERRGLWEQALCLLESLSRAIQVRSSSLNVAMSACEKGQQWQATLFLFSRFSHFCCDRTLVSYGAASAACAVSQSWETALEVLSEMQGRGVGPSKEMLNSLLEVCKRSWAWQQGLQVFLESRELGLRSFRQREALCQAVETSQALFWAETLALRPLSLLDLRRATLSDQRFVWRSSKPVHVASAEWLVLANIFAADSIRQSLEQRNGFGSRWR
ncbi:PTAC2 [Symbiodinium necroappetens]|uniref:PTAC2 protein n=1 Tax=Symbiodinium necroappetens TaxID=1628268 RepID=A0A812P874_9DINO|nr:PTAC2 [Symbiodinium necroappetens]